MRNCLVLAMALAAEGIAQTAPPSPCTVEGSKRAFDAVDKLNNWQAVRRFYKTYLPCDDGGIAEGVSDAVTKLLANKWTDYWRVPQTATPSPAFRDFVLRHIDATVSIEILQSIHQNARQRCPKRSSEACEKIDAAALSAIRESEQ